MHFNIKNINQQVDSLPQKTEGVKTDKNKKHGVPDSIINKQDDTVKKEKDTLTIKDSTKLQKETVVNDSSNIILNHDSVYIEVYHNKFDTHRIFKVVPPKTNFILKDIQKYPGFSIDSVLTSTNLMVVTQKYNYLQGKTFIRNTSDWMIAIIVFSLVVLGWVYSFFRKYLSQIFLSAFDENISHKLMTERSSITERVSFAVNVLFILNTAFFVYEIFMIYKIPFFEISGFYLFALFFVIITFIYVFKYIFYSLIGYILNASREAFEYIHNIFLYNKIFGLVLIPITGCIPFFERQNSIYLTYLGLALFVISLLFRMIRGFQISMKINFSISYLILYLCAVEILPILIIGKFFYKLINSQI